MSFDFEYNSSFAFSHPGWDSDPVTNLAELALAEISAQTPHPGPIEDFATFAQQLHATGLPICETNDLEDLNNGTCIGSGTTMTVFKCLWKSKNKVVAVKRVNLGISLGQSQDELHSQEYADLLKSLLRELRVMNHPWCRAHPNFVDLLGVSWDVVMSDEGFSSYRPAMIVELADFTTPQLRDLVRSYRYPLDIEAQQLIFHLLTDVAEGVTMLHAMKIVHGDLKPDNILLFPTENRVVAKLSDFGFCSPFTDREYHIGGTLYWNAPECMPDAPQELRSFSKTITRDLYSFGLVMSYSLFSALPYSDVKEEHADPAVVQNWKLKEDPGTFLHEQITIYAPDLRTIQFPLIEGLYGLELQGRVLLWFQIWVALTELLRRQANERHIRMGQLHLAFNEPQKFSEIFLPQIYDQQQKETTKSHVQTTTPLTRPTIVSSMNQGLQKRSFGKFDPFRLGQVPLQIQSLLLKDFEAKYLAAVNDNQESADLALVLSNCHDRGFGCLANPGKARQYEILAAQAGCDAAQTQALCHGLLDGFDPTITSQQKINWLKTAICSIFFPLGHELARGKKKNFGDALEHIPDDLMEHVLVYSFAKSYMDERTVCHLAFDGAAEDELFSLVINNDREKLVAALKSDMQLLDRKKDGFTLLHVAADYCRQDIIHELVRGFSVNPDIKSDHGVTAIELAVETGSVDCVRLLISLGADITPLADQELFTSVAMTGTRNSLKNSPASGNTALLSLICKVVEEVSGKEASKALINGQYGMDRFEEESEYITPGSPLELAVSVQNYDSVIALLNMGADPNAYSHLPPLHIAASLREPMLALLLLAYRALPNLTNRNDGGTAIHCCNEETMAVFAEAPRSDVVRWQQFVKDGLSPVDIESDESVNARAKACMAILLHFGAHNCQGDTALA